MWVSCILRIGLALLVVLSIINESGAILTQPNAQSSQNYNLPNGNRKVTLNPRLYRYLKGYYEQAKGQGAPSSAQSGAQSYVPVANEPSLNNPQTNTNYLEPKSSGLRSGQYSFAQSPNYLQKLKRLAALLKARAAQRAKQRITAQQQQGYGQPQPAPAPRQTYQPQPQPQPQPKPVQQNYPPPQPAQPAPQRTYPQPVPQPKPAPQPQPAPQQSPPRLQYAPVQLPARTPKQTYAVPVQSAPSGYGSAANVPAQSSSSYQSLGLPSNIRIVKQPSPPVPTPQTTPKPTSLKVDADTLVKLLKASYASLMPLLLNQAKMTSYGVQTIPLYGSNPYRVFGPMTYGPLPKPNMNQMSLSYNQQSFANSQSHPLSNSGFSGYSSNSVPAPKPQQQGYGNSPSQNNAYGPQPQRSGFASQNTGYGSQTSQGGGYGSQSSGYGSQSSGYGSQSSGYGSQSSGYGSQSSGYGSQSSGYGSQSSQNTDYGAQNIGYGSVQSYEVSPDITCGPISEMFCQGRSAGLYSHPASGNCFVQCDHVGRGHARSCSPGTSWKELGPEPALFNYCS